MEKFSTNLARIMRERDINQVELSKKSGISQPRISGYLNESKYAKFPSLKNLIKLGRALHCSLEDLVGKDTLAAPDKKLLTTPVDQIELTKNAKRLAELYDNITDESIKELIEAMIIKAAESKAKKDKRHE